MRARSPLPILLAALVLGCAAGAVSTGCSDDAVTPSYLGAIDPDAAPPRIGPPPDAGAGGD